jgi:hypothetical protein
MPAPKQQRLLLAFPYALYPLNLVADYGGLFEFQIFGVFQHLGFQRFEQLFALGGDKRVVGLL